MANTSSAKRALRVSKRQRVFNIRRASTMRDEIKKFDRLVKGGKNTDAKTALPSVYKAIDKAAKRGIIKANTASRKKSRFASSLKKEA